jgi:transcriptional regulator with GAF, ATPase, and Fis domain
VLVKFSNDGADASTRRDLLGATERSELILLLIGQDGRPEVHRLAERETATIGRGRECAIRIDAPGISRSHALLHLEPDLAIEDLGSANGTRLRGEVLSAHVPHPIRLGETVDINGVLLAVQRRSIMAHGARVEPPLSSESEAMNRVLVEAARVARGVISVLIVGETGVGKDILAERIHQLSQRATRPFLRLNCAALSESLVDSELFGHEKGAFSGAVANKRGLIEMADGGTLFLDEVGELPLSTQAKLLRVLEQKEFFRVGGVEVRKVDLRLLAATNRNLEVDMARGAFRQDLFFRVAGVTLRVPPLRERRAEIAPLAHKFAADVAQSLAWPVVELSSEVIGWLEGQPWPGNVRELRNTIERAVLLSGGDGVRLEDLQAPSHASAAQDERERIVAALAQFGGNQTHAARHLGISRNTLLSRLERYGLARPRRQS